MRFLFVLALLPFATTAQPAPDPTPIVYLAGGAGSGGCYAQWATRSAVRAYSAPTAQSRHLRTVDAERRIDANDYSESLTAVLRPGRARARRVIAFDAVRLTTGRAETVQLREGDEVDVLAPVGTRSVYFTIGNDVFTGVLPGYTASNGDVEAVLQPVIEVWVRLTDYGDGRPASWLNTAEAGVAAREPFCE